MDKKSICTNVLLLRKWIFTIFVQYTENIENSIPYTKTGH